MAVFGKRSLACLEEAHPLIREVMFEAIKGFDFSVICGYRNEAAQNAALRGGFSKARFGQSPHNYKPSLAVDCTPFPLDWNDLKSFDAMARHIIGVSKRLQIPLRWGADWDQDGQTSDEKFLDRPHFELHPWRSFIKR